MAVLVEPVWAGVGVLYVGLVTGWLMRSVRRRLDLVRQTYGDFDAPSTGSAVSIRAASYLLGGAAVLAAVAVWDISVRGWSGVFGLALAACLGGAGMMLRRGG